MLITFQVLIILKVLKNFQLKEEEEEESIMIFK